MIKKLLWTLAFLLILCWILFNPYVYYPDSEFISDFSFQLNGFCRNISLSYHFSNDDVLNSLRFLEYFIFGICSAVLYKFYSQKIWANVANPLFFGLIVATVEIYLRNFGVYELGVQNILISFIEFCCGLFIVLIFCAPKNRKSFSSKYRKSKYIGRS